jgi:hypothetical protein
MKVETGIKGREQADILLIDFEHGYMDVRDPVDGVCRVPLEKKFAQMPTPIELTACVKKVPMDIVSKGEE